LAALNCDLLQLKLCYWLVLRLCFLNSILWQFVSYKYALKTCIVKLSWISCYIYSMLRPYWHIFLFFFVQNWQCEPLPASCATLVQNLFFNSMLWQFISYKYALKTCIVKLAWISCYMYSMIGTYWHIFLSSSFFINLAVWTCASRMQYTASALLTYICLSANKIRPLVWTCISIFVATCKWLFDLVNLTLFDRQVTLGNCI
jgi:hypothetical protein